VIGIVPALLLGGPLSDRHGRRPFVRVAPLIAAVAGVVIAAGGADPTLLFVGRVLSGIALGLGLAVGSSWVKELSQGSGARRASLSLTAGFGLGAVVAAALAQFGPVPTVLPYTVNIAVDLVACLLVWRVVETVDVGSAATGRRRGEHLLTATMASTRDRRFLLVVVPMAPWVFGTATSAYAVIPTLEDPHFPGFEVGVSGLLCLVALGFGYLVQPLARRFDRPPEGSGDSGRSARSVVIALGVAVAGMVLAAVTAATGSFAVALVAAAVLGSAYGLLMLSGLLEIQRIAGPFDLAGLTGVYYSLTYLGFFVPALLAALEPVIGYPALFAIGGVLALASIACVRLGSRVAAVSLTSPEVGP
jgi:MFS family permease